MIRGPYKPRAIVKTHCKRGHEFTPENTIIRPGKGRNCRECNKASQNDRYPRLKLKRWIKRWT